MYVCIRAQRALQADKEKHKRPKMETTLDCYFSQNRN